MPSKTQTYLFDCDEEPNVAAEVYGDCCHVGGEDNNDEDDNNQFNDSHEYTYIS